MMEHTEKLVSGLVKNFLVKYRTEGSKNPDFVREIDFKPPFLRFSMIKDLEKE
jgi:lysyl-tRNA synthetase class II